MAPDTPQPAPLAGDAERPPVDPAAADRLVARLRAICGDEHVLTDRHQLRTYESDGLLQYRVLPRAAVLPADGDEVAAVVRACHSEQIPWVARGSGSGLSGGALPVEDGVLIVLTRLRRILEVDLPNQRVVGEPGVTNVEISQAVGPTHFYPPDPSSQIVCSIGGNVAENSGGAHCFKYGFTTNYVCGLEVVLTDGTVVELGGKALDVPGYDLLGASSARRGRSGSRRRSPCASCPPRSRCARSSPSSRRPARRATPCRRSSPRASSPARSR